MPSFEELPSRRACEVEKRAKTAINRSCGFVIIDKIGQGYANMRLPTWSIDGSKILSGAPRSAYEAAQPRRCSPTVEKRGG